MTRVYTTRILSSMLLIALAITLASCADSGRTASNDSSTASASPVGHRWTVENLDGLLCYDTANDLETARSMGGDFENITPQGFHYTGDESAGGRLAQGDIISIDSAGNDYYIVTPIRAAIAGEGKSCAVDIASLQLSQHNVDAKQIPNWKIGSEYKGTNEITPCFSTYDLAALQYDAEVNNIGTGNGDQSLNVSDDPEDPARYRLQSIEQKVLTFYVVHGDADVHMHGYTMRSPHTGQTIYCAHESKPQPG